MVKKYDLRVIQLSIFAIVVTCIQNVESPLAKLSIGVLGVIAVASSLKFEQVEYLEADLKKKEKLLELQQKQIKIAENYTSTLTNEIEARKRLEEVLLERIEAQGNELRTESFGTMKDRVPVYPLNLKTTRQKAELN